MSYVSLTFDDGLDCHLDTVIPILNEFGMRGTFYLPLSAGLIGSSQGSQIGQRAKEWRQAATTGHELGNHSIFHAALKEKKWVVSGYALEDYTLSRMRLELMVANSLLKAIDGKDERTYAFPCSNPLVGRDGVINSLLKLLHLDQTRLQGWVNRYLLDIGSTKEDFAPILKDLFFACRDGGFNDFTQIPPVIDEGLRYKIPSIHIDNPDFVQLGEYTQRCPEQGRWLVLAFHGVGGGHSLNCDIEVFKRYIEFLSEQSNVQVVTLLEGAKIFFK